MNPQQGKKFYYGLHPDRRRSDGRGRGRGQGRSQGQAPRGSRSFHRGRGGGRGAPQQSGANEMEAVRHQMSLMENQLAQVLAAQAGPSRGAAKRQAAERIDLPSTKKARFEMTEVTQTGVHPAYSYQVAGTHLPDPEFQAACETCGTMRHLSKECPNALVEGHPISCGYCHVDGHYVHVCKVLHHRCVRCKQERPSWTTAAPRTTPRRFVRPMGSTWKQCLKVCSRITLGRTWAIVFGQSLPGFNMDCLTDCQEESTRQTRRPTLTRCPVKWTCSILFWTR